jgi:hypothetical protein
MDYIQILTTVATFITIMATLLAGFAFLYREIKSIEKDIKDDIKMQSARSDQLYTMFIDLLKEGRK